MSVDPHSHVPVYLQIVGHIAASIAAGVYRPGEALPSQRALAVALQVNPNTVQKAFDELERRGLVFTRRGVGLFVTDRGAASAQSHAEEAVAEAFCQGIAAGQGAGMSAAEIREIFDSSLRRTLGRAAKGAAKKQASQS